MATSGRSFTSTGTSAPAPDSEPPEPVPGLPHLLQPDLHRGNAPSLGRARERDQVASVHQAVVGHQHEADECRYIICHDAPGPPSRNSRSHDSGPQRCRRNPCRHRRAAAGADRGQRSAAGRYRERPLHGDDEIWMRPSRHGPPRSSAGTSWHCSTHPRFRYQGLCRNASACWCMRTPAGPGRKSSIAICAEPRSSDPTGCERQFESRPGAPNAGFADTPGSIAVRC